MATREILIVDDDPATLRALLRVLTPFRPCVTARTADEGCAALAEDKFCGLIVDVALETPRSGLRILSAFRAKRARAPAMIYTRHISEDIVIAADDARARVVVKGSAGDRLRSFAIECLGADLEDVAALSEVLGEYAQRAQLSRVELTTLHGALHGQRASWFKDYEGVALSTYKWRVASLLQKTGHDSLETLTNAIFWDAMRRASMSIAV